MKISVAIVSKSQNVLTKESILFDWFASLACLKGINKSFSSVYSDVLFRVSKIGVYSMIKYKFGSLLLFTVYLLFT